MRWTLLVAPSAPAAHGNSPASVVMNGSSVRSSRSGVTAMRLSASAERSVPCLPSAGRRAHRRSSNRDCRGRRGGRRCAAVAGRACPGSTPQMPLTSPGGQSGKLTLISTSRGMPCLSTRRMMSGACCDRRLPVRLLLVGGGMRLRQRERRNAEHRGLHGAGDGAGISTSSAALRPRLTPDSTRSGGCRQHVARAHDHAVGRRALDRDSGARRPRAAATDR